MIGFVLENPLAGALLVASWLVLCLYAGSALWWLFETVVLARGWRTDPDAYEWGLEDVQVRILTIDAEAVVQATVDAVPDAIEDVHVIAESDLAIDGATVHVVSDEFDCEATAKGRAVEWARRNVPCDREYVCYLDEDTIVTGFSGLPDADVVQFTEKPLYTGSWLAYCCEVFRIGYQYEQFGFHRLRYPLYAWGGGIAIRSSLEGAITWDAETVTEDTNFVWRAASERDISFAIVDARFRNQAPPSVWTMIRQRRRWISGTRADGHLLPLRYRPLYYTRIVAWAFSPLLPAVAIASVLAPDAVPSLYVYGGLSVALTDILFVYTFAGLVAYRKRLLAWPVLLLVTPVAVTAHAIGALWGFVSPVESFDVTEKVPPETIERVNAGLEAGDLTAYDGTERLVRDTDEANTLTGSLLDD
ncbi:glycosyltransferase [Halopiger goleimassiliensis]|uniref:glycosyltransferase n=1 Tax=Halopiger goleimassiliensis TaxID=1293048 RepID=UPI0006777926|nr:glycosyltransferase family 2 protein [Halopiger goleimassiliensis]